MKYLILLLLVMFSCNVNANNGDLIDFVNSLTSTEKQHFIKACETDNFKTITDIQEKALVCRVAATIKSYYSKKNRQALLDMYRYGVKSCNYYDLENQKFICDFLYKDYKQFCFIKRDEQICNILKDYYKLY